VKAYNGKTVEIINTDAEGRLCIVDAINFIQDKLNYQENSIIIDIATLTGNVSQITADKSSLCTSNSLGYKYIPKLIEIGEQIGEYVDYLKMRREYLDILKSEVADIKNCFNRSECIVAGSFLNFFVNEKIPWIHLDIASCVFSNEKVLSYGINLLYEFIQELENL
jgi:leucyl aminopeptidase